VTRDNIGAPTCAIGIGL